MNTFGLGRNNKVFGLGKIYSSVFVEGYKDIIRFSLYVMKNIAFFVER